MSAPPPTTMMLLCAAAVALAGCAGAHHDKQAPTAAASASATSAPATAQAGSRNIVFFRHGEKPTPDGLGQLACKGLNRALRLPAVLNTLFGGLGRPAAVFAPNPAVMIADPEVLYNYVRPLATVEPTAIALGLPVNTQFGYPDTAQLKAALTDPKYANALVYVVWEHTAMNPMLRQWDPRTTSNIPQWTGSDFDMVIRLTIDASNNVSWTKYQQGLDGQSTACPTP